MRKKNKQMLNKCKTCKSEKNATQPEQQKRKAKKQRENKGTHHWTAWRHLKKMQHSCHQGSICPLAKLVP